MLKKSLINMENNWNLRLKEAREKSNLSLSDVSEMLGISQQSLIKYEKGEVSPKINWLEKLCKKYNVTIDYILYNSSELSKSSDLNGYLVALFMLMHSNKLSYDSENLSLHINDKKLNADLFALNTFIKETEIVSIDDLSRLINGIRKLTEE